MKLDNKQLGVIYCDHCKCIIGYMDSTSSYMLDFAECQNCYIDKIRVFQK